MTAPAHHRFISSLACVAAWSLLAGCDEPTSSGCPELSEGVSASAEVTSDGPVLLLRALSSSGNISLADTTLRLTSDGPLLVLGLPRSECARLSYGATACARPHVGDLLAAATAPELPAAVTVQTPWPDRSIELHVLGRWPAGAEAVIPQINRWEQVYAVQTDALSVDAGQAPPSHRMRADAHAAVSWCYDGTRGLDSWRAWQTSQLIQAPPPWRCGDGLLHADEACDDGDDDRDNGCGAPAYPDPYGRSVCLPSPMQCDPTTAGAWRAWRCEGAPSQCALIPCDLASDAPACRAPTWSEPQPVKADATARVTVALNGRTRADTPHRAAAQLDPQTQCACEDDGWALTCDAACAHVQPCALLAFAPADPLDDLAPDAWRGCRAPSPDPLLCVADNLSFDSAPVAVWRRATPGKDAAAHPLTLSPGEQVQALEAVAASPDGSAWVAARSRVTQDAGTSHANTFAAVRLLYAAPTGEVTDLPTPRVSSLLSQNLPTFLAIAPVGSPHSPSPNPSPSAWALTTLAGRAEWRGDPIEPPPPSDSPGYVLVHVASNGDLLGATTHRDESAPLDPLHPPRLAAATSPDAPWSAAFGLPDAAQGELLLTALHANGDRAWRQILRTTDGAPITLHSLTAADDGGLWVGLTADSALSPAPFPTLAGLSGPLLLRLTPAGDLTAAQPWLASASALAADGLSLWSVSLQSSACRLRRFAPDAAATVTVTDDLPCPLPDTPNLHLWATPDGDLLTARPDPLGGLVTARFTPTPDGLSRRWLHRLDDTPTPAALSTLPDSGATAVIALHPPRPLAPDASPTLSFHLSP